jgi:hypothetical protein
MENYWPLEKAAKFLKIVSGIVIISGIMGVILSIDGFVMLGKRGSAFIFPYFFDVIGLALSVFQIYLGGRVFPACRPWMKTALFTVIVLRFLLGIFDGLEVLIAIALLYVVHVLKLRHAGWLLKERSQS